MRNFQRIRDGGVVASVTVTPPLLNSGVAISLSLDSAGGLESSSSLLRVKTRDTSFTRDASGVGVALRTNSGLQIATGLGVLLQTNPGLVLGATGLAVTLNATNPALSLTSGLAVTVSGTSLTKDATGVLVALRTNGGLSISSGLGVLLQTNPGLVLGATGLAVTLNATTPALSLTSGLTVLVAANQGLTKTASGIETVLADTSLAKAAGGLSVSLRTNGGLSISSGLGVLLPANSGLQLLAGGTSILLNPTTPALSLTSGLAVTVSGTSLTRDATGLLVSLRTTPGLQIATGLGVLLDATTPALSLTSGLTVLVAADQGLTKTASGIETVLADTSLAKAAGGLSVSRNTNAGLSVSTGLLVNTDEVTVERNANVLRVKDAGIAAAKLGVLTTKGDLLGYSTLHARVAGGTARQVLVADPTPATGLSWYTPQHTRNLFINGSLRVWQRGTTFAAAAVGTYSADRWSYRATTSGVVTLAQSTDAPVNSGVNFSHGVTVTTADAAPTFGGMQYRFENQDFIIVLGRPLVLSFWVKSNLTGTFGVNVQNVAANRTWIGSYTIATASTWQKVILTLTHDTTGTWSAGNNALAATVQFAFAASAAQQGSEGWQAGDFKSGSGQVNLFATVANSFQLALIQLEIGTVASEFEYVRLTDEHQRCRRYYQKSFTVRVNPVSASGFNSPAIYVTTQSGTAVRTGTHFPLMPEMRNPPVLAFFNPITATANWRNVTQATDSGAASGVGATASGFFFANPQVSGDVAGDTMQCHWTAEIEL